MSSKAAAGHPLERRRRLPKPELTEVGTVGLILAASICEHVIEWLRFKPCGSAILAPSDAMYRVNPGNQTSDCIQVSFVT